MYYSPEQIRELYKRGEIHLFYGSYEWQVTAREAIKAAHGECRMCKENHKLTKATTAHHIKYLRNAPELAYEQSNLLALCHDCHERIHERGIYAKPKGYTNDERW